MRVAALTMIILGCAACAGTSDGGGAEEASKKKKDAGTTVGCGSAPDMGASNPSPDLSSAPADLGPGNVGGACGSTFCRGDQICVAGQCTYACDGYNVPGDYASIQQAVNALQSVGGTICLGPQAFNEDVSIARLTAPLTIVGSGAGVTSTRSISANPQTGSNGAITIKALAVSQFIDISAANGAANLVEGVSIARQLQLDENGTTGKDAANLTVRWSHLGAGAMFIIAQSVNPENVLVDGCDFDHGGVSLNELYANPHGAINVTVQSTYFYNSAEMMGAALSGSVPQLGSTPNANITFVNNTVTGLQDGIYGSSFITTGGAIKNVNNVYYKNGTAIDDAQLSVLANGHDALYGNTTNYAGGAIKGPGYVTSDPLLDAETPPRPTAKSPLVGAADKNYLPATDYWGRPRTSADIGAVQH